MDMSPQEIKALLLERAALVEGALTRLCDSDTGAPARLRESMRYSLLAGGKRLRPVLCLTAASQFGTDHDDLPAMDNDDLRRGRPSNHKAFDEATAILAGDALQADAFVCMASCHLPSQNVLKALGLFAKAAGSCGMCGGQELDMQCTGMRIPIKDLEHWSICTP